MTPRPTPNLEGQVLLLVCPLLFDLSGLVNPARGIKTPAGIALRIMEAHKLPHHGKVATLGAVHVNNDPFSLLYHVNVVGHDFPFSYEV